MAIDEHGSRVTFDEYRGQASAAAGGFVSAGVSPGSTVGWMLPTRLETLVAMGALARLDAIQIPLLTTYGHREIRHAVSSTHATTVIVPEEFRGALLAARVREAVEGIPEVSVVGLAGRQLPVGDPPPIAASGDQPNAVRWILFTSGTTAQPKGVLHTDETLLASARALASSAELGPSDRNSLTFPIAHIGGVVALFLALETGAANVLTEHFRAEEAIELFEREGVTVIGAGPGFQPGYLSALIASSRPNSLGQVRAFLSGGAPKTIAIHEQLRRVSGIEILSSYGMTECPTATGHRPGDAADKLLATEGKANLGVTIDVRDLMGSPVSAGIDGELWLRGPQLCRGYLDRAANAEAFDRDGFLRTGDLGHIDEDGYLWITGRVKDIIIRKGENISAREIENLLSRHAEVLDVAVVGLPDDERGELCCAVVVPLHPAAPPTLATLIDHLLDEGLMKQKLPERLEIVDMLPRNDNGKVVKRELRDALLRSRGDG